MGGPLGLFKGKAGKGLPDEICGSLQKLIPKLSTRGKPQYPLYAAPEHLALPSRDGSHGAHSGVQGIWLRPRAYGCSLEL
eukprot:6678444-Prymnesium_polylepis.1